MERLQLLGNMLIFLESDHKITRVRVRIETLVPSHLEFHHYHHPCHKHLLGHLCQNLLVQSWEG